ncbi:helicase [Microbacterium sp. NPDC090007]|uniref:helicase n=1 Tax=Microbacterium sp. NPDC090007 TaxID=3364204 RepID=UPI003811F227
MRPGRGALMAGAAATVGVVAVIVGVSASLAMVGAAAVVAQRTGGTADAAALAAADTASGAVSGIPCEQALRVAEAGGAHLAACDVDGLVATITVTGAYGGISFDAHSRAGPPDASTP